MEFNNKSFEAFRNDVNKALEEVSKKYGVTIECGKIKYSEFDFDMALKVSKADKNVDGKRMKFEQNCSLYGFSKDDYEREFTYNGKLFKLVGFNIKSPKNCCSIYCVTDGKTYKCNDAMVKGCFREHDKYSWINEHSFKTREEYENYMEWASCAD